MRIDHDKLAAQLSLETHLDELRRSRSNITPVRWMIRLMLLILLISEIDASHLTTIF